MPVLKYRDPGSGNYLTVPMETSGQWATDEYVAASAVNAKNYTDVTHPMFAAVTSFNTDTALTSGVWYVPAWETYDAYVRRPYNVCTLSDMNTKGILLTQQWLYLFRFRVSFSTFSVAAMSTSIAPSFYSKDGSTLTALHTVENHISTTSAAQTVDYTGVINVDANNAPVRLAGQLRSSNGTATLTSCSLAAWGPLV